MLKFSDIENEISYKDTVVGDRFGLKIGDQVCLKFSNWKEAKKVTVIGVLKNPKYKTVLTMNGLPIFETGFDIVTNPNYGLKVVIEDAIFLEDMGTRKVYKVEMSIFHKVVKPLKKKKQWFSKWF